MLDENGFYQEAIAVETKQQLLFKIRSKAYI